MLKKGLEDKSRLIFSKALLSSASGICKYESDKSTPAEYMLLFILAKRSSGQGKRYRQDYGA